MQEKSLPGRGVSSTHAGEQCQTPSVQWLKLASATPDAERLTAEPQGFCHFLLIDNLLSLQMTQITASGQKPRRKHSSTVFILGWAAGSRQVTCFSSPYLAQSSPQTLFQLLTTTTLKILAYHPFMILAVQNKSRCVFFFYPPLPPSSLPESKSACSTSHSFQAQI